MFLRRLSFCCCRRFLSAFKDAAKDALPRFRAGMSGLFDARQAAAARDAAGKPTNKLNASFSAFDYAPAKLDNARSFLMDDYLQSGRIARKREEPTRDKCWDVLHYQRDVVPFEPRQGFSETKFHSGFMRRQGSQMAYLQQRVRSQPPKTRPHPLRVVLAPFSPHGRIR